MAGNAFATASLRVAAPRKMGDFLGAACVPICFYCRARLRV
ncbi:hypothetical protein HMPREF1862_01790 [Varibaculum cambriense]|uniref:Uncharacterized protein n=1 Tax=Varibaculum cambriense TaxID=184870 RepID=A0AB34WX14_9ACTO|nr:hypothetical protein HMPREF1862_01790 [Varibaculum cambriense]